MVDSVTVKKAKGLRISGSSGLHRLAAVLGIMIVVPMLADAQTAVQSQTVSVSSASSSNFNYPDFDVRYGIAAGADLAALVGKTETLGMDIQSFVDPMDGKYKLRGFGESQGLFDVPFDEVIASLWDAEGQAKIYSNLLEVKIEEPGEDRQLVYQRIGVSLLGLSVGYRMRIEAVRDYLPDGAVGIRTRLISCLDGNMFESFSSWYVAPVTVNGKQLTYLRLFSRPGIVDPFPGTSMFVKGLTPGQLSNSITTTIRDARRRAASQG